MGARRQETGADTGQGGRRGPLGRFLHALAIAAALLVTANLAAHLLYVALVLPRSLDARIERQLAEQAPEIEVLGLGDSHVQRGLAAPLLEGGFTLASGGENAVLEAPRVRYWLPRLESLRVVLLAADLHTFSTFRFVGGVDDAYWVRHLDYRGLARRTGDPSIALRGLQGRLAAHLGQGARIAEAARASFTGRRAEVLSGWVPVADSLADLPIERRLRRARSRAATHFEDVAPVDPVVVEAYESILRACAEAGVDVVLITYPVSGPYLDAVPADVEPAVAAVIDEIRARHPVVRARLDFLRAWLDRPEMFADQDHLNREGAEVLTAQIARRLGPGSGGIGPLY